MSTKHDDSCLKKAGDAEPIFVLRAQDQLAPMIVRKWAMTAKLAGTPLAKVHEAMALADAMDEWQGLHGAKRPD